MCHKRNAVDGRSPHSYNWAWRSEPHSRVGPGPHQGWAGPENSHSRRRIGGVERRRTVSDRVEWRRRSEWWRWEGCRYRQRRRGSWYLPATPLSLPFLHSPPLYSLEVSVSSPPSLALSGRISLSALLISFWCLSRFEHIRDRGPWNYQARLSWGHHGRLQYQLRYQRYYQISCKYELRSELIWKMMDRWA